MEDFKFSVVINRDTSARTLTIDLPPFTLIGATTRAGNLSAPLRSRFGITEKLNFYDIDECVKIVKRTAKVFNATIEDAAALEIARRSRGTPRIANRLFRRVRDFANYAGKDHITVNDALQALKALKVDELGLDDVDIRYLRTVIERFKGLNSDKLLDFLAKLLTLVGIFLSVANCCFSESNRLSANA